MSLNDSQRARAHIDGGKEISNRKRHLSQIETGLRTLRDECENSETLRGALAPDELKTLARAAVLVGQVAARLDADAREAKRIKADYDKRVKEAIAEYGNLPHTEIADIVALSVLAGERAGISRYTMDTIRERPHWLTSELTSVARDAINNLAHDCAREKNNPKGMVKRALEVLIPAIKENHADLIRELNALAVQAQLEKSA